ncbi:MAG: hypothetical protein HUU35_14440, partial [Armatimonadetes bacterium]|nr:hypothetical protein [Armatimonadota bacterium]
MPIVALTGGPRSGRTTAAQSLRFLGYEPVSFGNRLRHMIAMSTGLADTMMLEKADQTFERAITLQAFHIDGMCRLAAAWTTIPDEAPKRMRERAARSALQTPREVMDFVRHDLFEECASPSFWVDAFRAHYEPDKDSNFVVDDAASAVEKQFVRTLGGLILGIARTEGEGDFSECDFVIQNDGGIEQLQDRVISAVVGHYRGVPIQLADAPLPLPLHLVDPSKEEAARQEAESLRKQIDELAARMRTELQARDRKLEEMGAERDALAAKSHEHERALEVLSREAATPNGDAAVAMAVAPPQA